ncbi:type II secretion system protein [Tundrisphaera sp. TA3]|uniref:type II secretion system protein n=1 Tax=Tundrisphaera sp. TA3 TaxID=3435775 RepID=UPI003EB876EE
MRCSLVNTRPRRQGLTLVELLVVILIIGTLMAILIPAVSGAIKAARQAQVTSEMSNLASALADFRNRYGEYPPSRFYCAEDGNYQVAATDTADIQQLKQRSLRYLRKFWPRVAITNNGTAPTIGGQGYYDFNGNAINDSKTPGLGPYILQGPECLVFFLGGIPKKTGTGGTISFAMMGFGKDPLNPFITEKGTATTNRQAPLFEFNSARLDDSEGPANDFPSYLDPLGSPASIQPMTDTSDKRPYAYFCAYGNNAYDPNDYNAAYEIDDSSGATLKRKYYVSFLPSASLPVESAGPNPYTVSGPIGGTAAAMTSATFQNPQSFQLISSGIDRKWGIGGDYSTTTPKLPFNPTDTSRFFDAGTYITPTPAGNPRLVEQDNLANFAGGRLE